MTSLREIKEASMTALSTMFSSTSTLPAMINALALSRVARTPFSTSNLSNLILFILFMHHLPNCLNYPFLINAVQSSQFLLRAMFYKFIPDSQTLYRHVAYAFSLKKLQNSAAEAP